ncbi:hypothetical protein [Candidatus Nitrospira bockiana]
MIGVHRRLHPFFLVLLCSVVLLIGRGLRPPAAHAACGAVTCFLVIPSQQVVAPQGLLTINGIYAYTPMVRQDGTSAIIPEVDVSNRRILRNHHRELNTVTQTFTLDLNYGLTDRLGLQLTIPYHIRRHDHFHVHGGRDAELLQFRDRGIGDIRVTAKYNWMTSLRSMIVSGVAVELPTGDTNEVESSGEITEPPIQLGRGQAGLIGHVYQTYELIPHRLNQFAFASYRHTFRNNFGYQYGDEYLLNVGLNLVTVPWLILTNQLNYRYMTHDNFSGRFSATDPITNLDVPNTGHTFLAYTPGFLVSLGETWQMYFYSQIPIARDGNGNLVQGVSYTFGITKFMSFGRS